LALKQKIEFFIPRFKTAIINSRTARDNQTVNSRHHSEHTRKARLYISHFLQVLNLTILRGELKPAARAYYGLPETDARLPPLVAEQDLVAWGEKLIHGEQERTLRGGTPIYSPSIALVRVNFEKFKQASIAQKQFQQSAARYSAELARYRADADALVLDLWNDIEKSFDNIPDENQRRARCEQYGITYVYRKGEREKHLEQQEMERINPRLPF
ncbi:MAG: hypothetical protein LBI96_04455, partial [Odoribacteraceae bacterium]|nr:hypothetical protein [Odoribacteraceae bacterium]